MFTETEKFYGETPEGRYNELRSDLEALALNIVPLFMGQMFEATTTETRRKSASDAASIYVNLTWLANTPKMMVSRPIPALTFIYYPAAAYYNVVLKNMTELSPYSPSEFFLLANAMPLIYAMVLASYTSLSEPVLYTTFA